MALRWEPSLEAWLIEAAAASGPAGRVIVDLGSGVSVHTDRLELGRVVLLQCDSNTERSLTRQARRLVAAVMGDDVADRLADGSVGVFEIEWTSNGWLGAVAAATTGDDRIRTLWHAEVATALADGPETLRSVARSHAALARPALEAVTKWWPQISSTDAGGVGVGQLAVLARTVYDLLDGDISDELATIAETTIVPAAVESRLDDRAFEESLAFRGGGTRTPVFDEVLGAGGSPGGPVHDIHSPIRLFRGATWTMGDDVLRVDVEAIAAPLNGHLRCWARLVIDGLIADQALVVFGRGGPSGSAVMAAPSSTRFEVHVTTDKHAPVRSADDRTRESALRTGAQLADRMRDMVGRSEPDGWRDLEADWNALATSWDSVGRPDRAETAQSVAEACRDHRHGEMLERFGRSSMRQPVLETIGHSAEAIASAATPETRSSALLAVMEGTWSASVRRLGYALWDELRHADPVAARAIASQTVAASASVDDGTDIQFVSTLLDALAVAS